ncbi:MAG: P27 family phage terminase small subunit [Pseudomonadota bacterium]|nr:P27 family phage terminase small subunit [Pseudomonadota bacterium]
MPRAPAKAKDRFPEPAWKALCENAAEIAAAKAHWKRIIDEMAARETLAEANGHSVQRLVLAYLNYDRAAAQVAKLGVVHEPATDNPRAISRLSIHFKAQSEAEKTAERLEAQLGLSPQRRGKVAKVTKKRERSAGADAFLGPQG